MSASAERLNDIWRAWSLGHAHDLKKSQRAALEKLARWLDPAEESARVVRATQALLVDPERPGVGKRALFKPLWDVVQDDWPGSGSGDGDVLQLQAMLLAAWPREERGGAFAVLPTLASPWEVMRGRQRQRTDLRMWWDEAAWTDKSSISQSKESAEMNSAALQSLLRQVEQAADTSSATHSALQQLINSRQDQHFVTFGPHELATAAAVKALLGQQIPQITQALLELIEEVAESPLRSAENDSPIELLWWGQARYCYKLRKPFRRIGNLEQRMWWLVWEAIDHVSGDSTTVDVEPVAAYVQEVLHAVGLDLNETHSLGEWLARLQPVLREVASDAPMATYLAQLAREDATALPVTWLRLHADDSVDLEAAADALLLPLDATLDRGQWAAWIFRELLLDWHFEDEGES
jgi:hypothetical protein